MRSVKASISGISVPIGLAPAELSRRLSAAARFADWALWSLLAL